MKSEKGKVKSEVRSAEVSCRGAGKTEDGETSGECEEMNEERSVMSDGVGEMAGRDCEMKDVD